MQKNFLLWLLVALTSCSSSMADPLLVVVLMVKDEAPVMEKTLQPWADAGVDSFFIFDTGSTDDTRAVTQDFFRNHDIKHGFIAQEPFVNFEVSRNRALELTEQQFPDACFMLMLDAEWVMHNVEGLLEFCTQKQHDACPAYLVRIIGTKLDFYQVRLIRCACHMRFIGVVHEAINSHTKEKVPEEVYVTWHASEGGEEKTRKRLLRDCIVLHEEYERNPDNPRTVFYLAQTYTCLQDWNNARIWYEKTHSDGRVDRRKIYGLL